MITLAGEVPTSYVDPSNVERRTSNAERRTSNVESREKQTKRISTYVSLTSTASGSPAKNSLAKNS